MVCLFMIVDFDVSSEIDHSRLLCILTVVSQEGGGGLTIERSLIFVKIILSFFGLCTLYFFVSS